MLFLLQNERSTAQHGENTGLGQAAISYPGPFYFQFVPMNKPLHAGVF